MTTPTAIALGFFDGVHAAHLRVLRAASAYAAAHGLQPVAVTFDRAPKAAVTGEATPLICTATDRAEIMQREAGISRVVALEFTDEMRTMPPRDFAERVVLGQLGARYCAVGADYRFGARGAGDAALLADICAAHGAVCEIVPLDGDDAGKISSTRIREAIAAGNVAEAAAMLGREFVFSGVVQHGKALGRTLGFRTMNVPVPDELVLPTAGVYVCRVQIDGAWYRAVCNTAHNETRLCEVHAFDFSGDVYGQTVRVALCDFVRGMRPFPSWDALAEQVEIDKKIARDWFSCR